jgi:hypothetical protein
MPETGQRLDVVFSAVSPPGPPDHFSIFIPLLSVLSTVRSYMRGIKTTNNIPPPPKYLRKSSLSGRLC